MSDYMTTVKIRRDNKSRRDYPHHDDPRCHDKALFPEFRPRFDLKFNSETSVFTIGSCFARNIEQALEPLGVVLPTMDFRPPPEKGFSRSNGLLNEYNPGTISQRILDAIAGKRNGAELIVPQGELFADLRLPGGAHVTMERALERQEEMFQIYTRMIKCDVIVITLGFIEVWFDTVAGQYLNRMPPFNVASANPSRYEFQRLDVAETFQMLNKAVAALGQAGKKVVITVSPVPIQTTFVNGDCVTSNEYSKSILRIAAERLYRKHIHVDYFPSFEIVRSAGLSAYGPDNVHVKDELVQKVTRYMVDCYQQKTKAGTASPELAEALAE